MFDIKLKAGAYDPDYLKFVISNGFQAMPAVSDLSRDSLDEIVEFLSSREETGAQKNGKINRMPYKKLFDADGFPAVEPPWVSY